MSQVNKESDIAALKEVKPAELGAYDLIGLGSPVWAAKEPPNVTAFINGMAVSGKKHVFPFCTHGALPSGFMQSVVPLLRKKGLQVIGYHDWYGGCVNQILPKPYLTDGHPDEIDLAEAMDFGREMAERSRRIYAGETSLIPRLPTINEWNETYSGRPVGSIEQFEKMKAEVMRKRSINADKCTGCGLCAANCPFDSIDLTVSPPVFKSSCFGCFFCEEICPEGAIDMEFEEITRIHDEIVRNIFMTTLARAEAKGRFRRLVPLKDIGWNTHWYQISKPPRYIIE
jgi:ferredoxin